LKFAFSIFAACNDAAFEVKADTRGWNAFVNSQKVRNRLTHPKSSSALEVSDKEVKDVREASRWFVETLKEVCLISEAMQVAKMVPGDVSANFEEGLRLGREREANWVADKTKGNPKRLSTDR
jgi:hypothetical protein